MHCLPSLKAESEIGTLSHNPWKPSTHLSYQSGLILTERHHEDWLHEENIFRICLVISQFPRRAPNATNNHNFHLPPFAIHGKWFKTKGFFIILAERIRVCR